MVDHPKDYKEIEAKIIARAWKEPAFKKKLTANPREVFEEMGWDFEKNITVRVIEDNPNSFTFVLPATPSNIERLSESQLIKIAAAWSPCTCATGMECSCSC
jgi:hypothetical protein